MLWRSPLALVVLLAYPLVVAALVGLVASYANAKPRVALVDEDRLPASIEIGDRTFHVGETIDRVADEVTLVRLDRDEAERQLASGRIVAMLVVPRGFVADLRGMVRSPQLELETTRGRSVDPGQPAGAGARLPAQPGALRTPTSRRICATSSCCSRVARASSSDRGSTCSGSRAHGACSTSCLRGRASTGSASSCARPSSRWARPTTRSGRPRARSSSWSRADAGRTWALSAQVQSYALALTISFLALLLAAAALAGERDEGVLGRLRRGLVGPGELVAAKVALAVVAALAVGLAIAVAFGVIIELGDVEGGQPWTRLPILAAGLALAGAALGRARLAARRRSPARAARRRSSRSSPCFRSSSSGSSRARSRPPPR